VDTKGSHADLTDAYGAVPTEMKEVAHYFGKEVLREVDENEFYENIAKVREALGNDRAILRAIHFFNENKRVQEIVDYLNQGDFNGFKSVIQASGNSSYKYLQNVYADFDYKNQAISLGLAMSEMILKNHGVCRVHGGGFAGTILTFVPFEQVKSFFDLMHALYGENSAFRVMIRNHGTVQVEKL